MKKSNVYTFTGDAGSTSLVGGKRVRKNDIRVEAYGSVDELNANIGVLAGSSALSPEISGLLQFTQNKLFNIGTYLATDNPHGDMVECRGLSSGDVEMLEDAIDRMDAQLPPINNFILPGGTFTASLGHVCRTMCRRCERRVISLADETYVDPTVLKFINRLSDFFFVFSRYQNLVANVDERYWDKEA